MYWTKSQLDAAIEAKDYRFRNFFDTFGFIVIREFLNEMDYIDLANEYSVQYRMREKEIHPQSPNPDMQFLPNFVDSSPLYTDYFFSDAMQKIYRYFAGEDYLYLGSDGSHFIKTSFPWHRDWFTRTPIFKFNFYFNEHEFEGGKFMIIPGSHHVGDAYAANIQKAMAWPMPNKLPGGLGENGWLPETRNPRSPYIEQILMHAADIPHVELTINQGDLIIFDHRAVHCVQTTKPEVPRRLLTVLLSENAFETKIAEAPALMREIVDLVVSERNHIGCDAWGSAILNHAFSKSKHFIHIWKNLHDPSLRYDAGRFYGSEYFLCQEHYAATGKAYREKMGATEAKTDGASQGYSYGDVHLGINAQNVWGVK
jgi:hypothetical protein